MKRSDFRFFDRLRVRWAEVDMQKIVFNGHYLMYFDTAVAAYWRALALPYHETMEALEGDLFVRKATVEYLGSARYDDLCEVGLRCARIGTSSMNLVAALFRGEQLLVHGELVYVFADPRTQKSRPVPPPLRETLQAYEAGGEMARVEQRTWPEARDAAIALRQAVFGDEQGVAEGWQEDAADAGAVHAVVLNRFERPVASGRLVMGDDGRGQIGRMAVAQSVRGAGIGRSMLGALMQEARARGLPEVMLVAHGSAVPFYAAAGFERRGERFVEAGLEHQAMVRVP